MINNKPKRIIIRDSTQLGYYLDRNHVICPVCGETNRVPTVGKMITQNGEYLYRCYTPNGCKQKFLHNPFPSAIAEGSKATTEVTR